MLDNMFGDADKFLGRQGKNTVAVVYGGGAPGKRQELTKHIFMEISKLSSTFGPGEGACWVLDSQAFRDRRD